MNRKTKIVGILVIKLVIAGLILSGCIGEGEDDNFYILDDGATLEISDFMGNLTLSITGNYNEITIAETVSLDSVKITGLENIVYVSNNHTGFSRNIAEGSNSQIVVYD